MKRRLRRRIETLGMLAVISGCACRAPETQEPSGSPRDPRRYFPLEAGSVYSYTVSDGSALPTLATLRVLESDPRAGTARIQRNQQPPEALVVTAEGIRLGDADAWLLRAPLEVDATFPGQGGRIARVVAVDDSVRTGLGEHHGCVRISERDVAHAIVAETTYCPGVGPALVVSRMRSTLAEVTLEVRAELIGRVGPEEGASAVPGTPSGGGAGESATTRTTTTVVRP